MPVKQKLNVRLLRKIQKHILEEPKRLNMMDWGKAEIDRPDDMRPPCATVGCIAGWACHLSGKKPRTSAGFARLGAEVLGLSMEHKDYYEFLSLEHGPAAKLFIPDRWPARFRNALEELESFFSPADMLRKAKITAKRIDHFIATGK